MAGKALSGIGAALQTFGSEYRRNMLADAEEKRAAEMLKRAIEKDKFDREMSLKTFDEEAKQNERSLLLQKLPFLNDVDAGTKGQYDKAGLEGMFSQKADPLEEATPKEFLMGSMDQANPTFSRNLSLGEKKSSFELEDAKTQKSKRDMALKLFENGEAFKMPAHQRAVLASMAGVDNAETFDEWKKKEAFKQAGDIKQAQIYASSRGSQKDPKKEYYDQTVDNLSKLYAAQLNELRDDPQAAGQLIQQILDKAAQMSGFNPLEGKQPDQFAVDLQDLQSDYARLLKEQGNPKAAKAALIRAASQAPWAADFAKRQQYVEAVRGLE